MPSNNNSVRGVGHGFSALHDVGLSVPTFTFACFSKIQVHNVAKASLKLLFDFYALAITQKIVYLGTLTITYTRAP